ncbi:MAG: hypothetical protein ACP5T0_09770 [Verrucomicrobiia bacterium]
MPSNIKISPNPKPEISNNETVAIPTASKPDKIEFDLLIPSDNDTATERTEETSKDQKTQEKKESKDLPLTLMSVIPPIIIELQKNNIDVLKENLETDKKAAENSESAPSKIPENQTQELDTILTDKLLASTQSDLDAEKTEKINQNEKLIENIKELLNDRLNSDDDKLIQNTSKQGTKAEVDKTIIAMGKLANKEDEVKQPSARVETIIFEENGIDTAIKNFSINEDKSDGTLIAHYEDEMNNRQDIDKFAVTEGKKMPVEANFVRNVNEMGEKMSMKRNAQLSENSQMYLNQSVEGQHQKIDIKYAEDFDGGEIKIKSISTNLLEEIKPHLLTIRHNNSVNDMTIKLKPDGETELSIRMVLNGEKIVATACVEKGDWYVLRSQWGELQNALTKYGVDLGSLNFGNNANQNAQRWNYSGDDNTAKINPSKITLTVSNSPSTEGTRKYSLVHNGWECWA